MSALLVDEHDPDVDRRALDSHLAGCPTCAWPAEVVGRAGTPPVRRVGRRRPRVRYLGALVAVLLAVVILGPALYLHLEGRPPARLTLPVGPGGATGPLDGTWSVGAGSAAEYRVDEQLFGQHNTAVGRTSRVTGTITIAGATVTSGQIAVDMASISTGNAGRDTVVRDHLLDTSDHPDATFTLTKAIDMGNVPADGATVQVRATGSLGLRGEHRTVTFPLMARRQGRRLDVAGDLQIHFRDWGIPDPSFAITSVSSTGDIDLLLLFSPAAG